MVYTVIKPELGGETVNNVDKVIIECNGTSHALKPCLLVAAPFFLRYKYRTVSAGTGVGRFAIVGISCGIYRKRPDDGLHNTRIKIAER